MATSMTRATALSAAIVLLENDHQADAANVLRKMRDSITKPRSKDSSKAVENAQYAQKVYDQMTDEPFTNKQVCESVNGLPVGSKGTVSPQKVSAILKVGVSNGLFTKTSIADGTVILYQKVVDNRK